MNMFVTRLVLFLFLSSAALVRRAQNEFYKNDGQNPLRGLFNFEGGNVANGKDSFDEGNIQKVIGILQNNIKQWSFIESQLLEPNVNLGMPEIFIPLKHLTTTLEILGNIFFAQNDLAAAKSSLERACPLMELLPANLLSDEDFSQVAGEVLGDHGYRLDPAELSSYLWIGGDIGADINRALLQANSQGQGVAVQGEERSSYAAGCFSLLRDVYTKLYGDSLPPPPGQDELETIETTEVIASTATETPSHGARRHDNTVKSPSPQPQEYSSSNLKYSSHQGGYNSYLLPNGKPREFNLKYLLSKRQQRQQMKQRALYSRFNNSAGSGLSRAARGVSGAGSGGGSTGGGVRMHSEDAGMSPLALQTRSPRSTKVSGAKLSMAAATAGSAYLEKSMAAQLQEKSNDENDKDEKSEKSEEQSHRRRNHDLLQGVDGDFLYDTSNTDSDTSSNTPSGAKKVKSTPSTPRRTSVFSGADEEEVELTTPLIPATATPVVSTGTERQPSPLKGPSHADKHRHQQQQEQAQKVQRSVKTQKPSPAHNFDFEQKLRDLRSPYEHLRSELQLVQGSSQGQAQGQNPAKRPASATPSRRDSDFEFSDDADASDVARSGSADGGSGSGGGRRVGLGLSSSSNRSKPQAQKASPSGSAATPKPAVRGFEGSSLNSINGEDITAPGVSTSVIADDLELLLRQFVAADRKTRKELLLLARKYYDELDINYPNMDYNEYAANMDVGQAYLEVMGRAAEEGFAFINAELEVWKATTAEAHRKHVSEKYDTAKKSLESKLGGSVQAKKGASGSGSSGSEAKGKSKSKSGKKDSSSTTTTTPTPSSSSPLQVTLAERNRLLVLYAFDIVHTDPSDPFDLGLGFNRGIVDNDRSRRGDHFMSDVLHEAIVTMGLDGALGGILGTNSADDAHKRLFPQDGSSHSIGASDHLTEQHLRELLSEGGAEEYMAARSSAAKSKAAKNRRRKQRAAQVEGGGEYTREESDTAHRSTGGSSGGGSTSSGSSSSNYFEKDFKDGAGDLFDDEMLAASFRSSVPSIEGDWTLALFVLFMLLTGAVVYSAYQEAARKKAAASRSRLRQGGAGAKQKASLLSGTGLVDFMYAQLNGAPGEDGESESSGGGSGGSGSGNVGGDSGSGPLRQLSSLLFPTKQDNTTATSGGGSKVGTPNGSTTNSNSNGSGSSNAKAKKAARESALAAQQQQLASADSSATAATAPSTLLGDILSYIPGSAARNAPSNSASNSANSGGGAEGERGAMKNSESSKQSSKSDRDSADHATSKSGTKEKEKDGSAVQSGTSNTSTASAGKGKNAKKSNSAASSKNATNTANATTNPATNTTTTSNTTSNTTTLPRATSNTTLNSSNGSSDDESTDSYVHPVALGNRRVSWAGLIPGTTQSTNPTSNTPEGVFEEVEQGDWAEARKKGSKRSSGANSNGTAEEGGNGGSVKPERIALGLKDSPLYRQPGGGRGSGGGSFPPRSQQPFANNSSTANNTTTATNKPFNAGASNSGNSGVSSRPSASQLAAAQYAHTTPHTTSTATSATTDTALPYSRAAAGTTATNSSTSNTGTGASGGRAGKMYDLSEAKRLAEQMGGWSAPVTSGGSGSASGTGNGGDVSPKSAASGPPGLQVRGAGSSTHPSIATATSPLHAGLSTPPPLLSPSNTTSNTPSNTTSSFGFSQLDLSAAGYSSTTGVWGTSLALNGITGVSGASGGSGASSNPSLASLAASLSATANTGTATNATASTAGASNSALAAQSAAYAKHKKDGSNGTTSGGRSGSVVSGAELSHSTYLGDLVSYLDSSTLSTTGTSGATLPYSTSAATAASLYADPYRSASSLYATNTVTTSNGAVSGSSAGAGTSAEADNGVLSAEYDHLDDGYYHVPSSAHTTDDLYYNHQYAYDTALYNTNTTANSTHDEVYSYDYDTTSYGEYNYTEPSTTTSTTTARRDHGGPRQTPLAQPSADFAPSITLEASSLYGLSPDAPSFRPSRATASAGTGTSASGGAAGGGASSGSGSTRLSAFSSRYEPSLSSLTDIIGASGVGSTSTNTGTTTSGGVGGGFGLGLFGDSSILQPTMLQPSASSALHVPLSSTALHSSSQALFNSDDFYESILIDSILGGEEGEADDEPHHD